MRTPLIVGVDPGTTTAYAVLDTRGKLIKTHSSKGLDQGAMIKAITEIGNPIAVGCDKAKPPSAVERLAVKVGANS